MLAGGKGVARRTIGRVNAFPELRPLVRQLRQDDREPAGHLLLMHWATRQMVIPPLPWNPGCLMVSERDALALGLAMPGISPPPSVDGEK